jgi:hypothetical protein
MKDWWLKFGCFLTGYNYRIVKQCSEVTAKEVKRYASALLIVSILWAFIGYTFTNRYLNAGTMGSIFGAIILVIIIIQVERQIILSLAVTMSLVGSIIIDQIILKEDIEQKKIETIDEKVNKLLPNKAMELKQQIHEVDSALIVKENERTLLQADIMRRPTIETVTTTTNPVAVTRTVTDTAGRTVSTQNLVNTTTAVRSAVVNPNIALVQQLDVTIDALRQQKLAKDSLLLTLRPSLETELKARKGFLDELEVMYRLVSESGIAFFVWLLWVLIILGIELFVLISKIGEEKNDYHDMVHHQMAMHKHKLKLLEPKEGFD